jgi:hypothetical protein
MPGYSYSINALTAPDPGTVPAAPAATAASTLLLGEICDHINIDVVNQAIYWQLALAQFSPGFGGYLPPQQAAWDANVTYQIPGSRTLNRQNVCGFRFWAAVKAASLPSGSTQAIVTVEIVT